MFYTINSNNNNKNHIYFFIENCNLIKLHNTNTLFKPSKFTSTSPDFRANLEVSIIDKGFSSYQSEFPYRMSTNKGSMFTSSGNLVNMCSISNILFIRNIYNKAISESFKLYIWDEQKNVPLDTLNIFTNITNVVDITKYLSQIDNSNLGIYADGYLCIPIYLSQSSEAI